MAFFVLVEQLNINAHDGWAFEGEIGLGMGGWTAWCGYSQSHGRPTTAAHVTGAVLFTL